MSNNNLIHMDAERRRLRGERKPLQGGELIDEVVFLLDQGTHPLMVAQQVGRSWESITRTARAVDRSGEVCRFDIDGWRRYTFADKPTGWGYAA